MEIEDSAILAEQCRNDGFGDIDSSNVVLHRNPLAAGEAIDGMENAIREAFMLTRQAQATTSL